MKLGEDRDMLRSVRDCATLKIEGRANGSVFISGQIPLDPATGNLITGGIEEQTERY